MEFIKEEKCEMKKLKEKARDERNKVGEYVRESFAYTYIHTYIYIYIYVRTRFVSNHNSVGFAHKKAQTISFVERGFERLGLSHQTVGFSWCSYMI